MNGTIIENLHAGSLRHDFEDACALDGLAEKWQIDAKAVLSKMDILTMPQWIVLVQWAAAFWENENQAVETYAGQLA